MKRLLAILLLLGLLTSCVGGGGGTVTIPGGPPPTLPTSVPPAPSSLPLDSASWYQDYVEWPGTQSATELAKLTVHGPTAPGCPAGAVCSAFADRATGKFNSYLLTQLPGHMAPELNPPLAPGSGLSGYKTLTFTITVIASPSVLFAFDSEPLNLGVTPPHIRAVIIYGQFTNTDRWFSHYPASGPDAAAFQLTPVNSATVTVPLTPDHWVDVAGQYGTTATAQFAQSMANPQWVGVVCGGGSFFPHGCAALGGPAALWITRYSFSR